MRILLDTHIFLWFIAGDAKLDDFSRELIENPDNGRYLSIASLASGDSGQSTGRGISCWRGVNSTIVAP